MIIVRTGACQYDPGMILCYNITANTFINIEIYLNGL